MKSSLILSLTLAGLLASVAAAQDKKPVNEFTSTAEDKAEVIEEGDDSFKLRCKGLAGYEVIFEGSHGRSWLNLVYDSEQTNLMDATLNECPGEFPSKANDVVQWRGYKEDGKFVPYALIYRMKSSAEGKSEETLIVIKLTGAGSTVVGSVPSNKGGNEGAEALADKLCAME